MPSRIQSSELSRANIWHYHVVKRVIDIIVSVCALITLLPLFVLVGLLIKVDSAGPILFVQKRIGSRRRSFRDESYWEPVEFSIYKFRSMVNGVDDSLHRAQVRAFVHGKIEDQSDGTSQTKIQDDWRITRVGRIIRRTSIDELPQLLNVLRGDMSLVGPRPVPGYEVELYGNRHFERLAAIPGLTGLWQVEGRGRTGFEEMIELDIRYVRTRTIWLDMMIMLRTIPAALSRIGAS